MKQSVFLIIMILLLVSCDNNKVDYGYDIYYKEIVTVTDKNLFTLDNGKTAISVNESVTSSLNVGDRILLHYTLLDEKISGYDYTIRINGLARIPQIALSPVSPEDIESRANEPIQFESVWIGSHFLNMQFYIDFKSEAHSIALLTDSTKLDNDTIYIYFAHNSNNDPPGSPSHLYISFDLQEVLGKPENNKPLLVNVNTSNYGNKTYELKY